MLALETIVKDICDRKKDILSDADLPESIAVYLFLKNKYAKDGATDKVFQFVFRSYYGLDRAGLSPEQKTEYFRLLANKKVDLETILSELYELPRLTKKNKNAIQFSFATKLLHTIDNTRPIFDTQVAKVIHKSVTGNGKKEKTESAKELYNCLRNLYLKLMADKKIQVIIKEFRENSTSQKITDSKVLDFVIWTLGKLKKIR